MILIDRLAKLNLGSGPSRECAFVVDSCSDVGLSFVHRAHGRNEEATAYHLED